jgi:hypothetical protein
MLVPEKIDIRDNSSSEFSRVYFFPEGEDATTNLLNNFEDNRPHDVYASELMPKILSAMGLPFESNFRWDQLAGCSCGCSPGFVIENSKGKDVYVTYVTRGA